VIEQELKCVIVLIILIIIILMGAIQAKFSKESSKDSSLPTDFGDDSTPTTSGQNDLLNS